MLISPGEQAGHESARVQQELCQAPPVALTRASGCWMRGAGGCPVCAPPPPRCYPERPLVPRSTEWALFGLIPWHPCTGLPTAHARGWRLQLTPGHDVSEVGARRAARAQIHIPCSSSSLTRHRLNTSCPHSIRQLCATNQHDAALETNIWLGTS